MTTRIRDFGKINYLVDRKVGDTNWEGFGKRTHTDARKAVYKEILDGFRSLQEAEEYIKDQPEGNVIFTARGDEITFSMLQVVIGHIKKNKWYSPWFLIPEHRVPMTSKGESRFERSRRMKAYWRTKEGQARAKHLGRYFEDSWTRCERCGGFLDVQGICKKCVRS